MPIIRNNTRVGTPNLYEVFPTITLNNKSRDPMSNIFSIVSNMRTKIRKARYRHHLATVGGFQD
jgi:hypothetical protein